MTSEAANGFAVSIQDSVRLLKIYDRERALATAGGTEETEMLKRAGFLLLVTAWESYIEDLLRERFKPRLAAATKPAHLADAFHAVATMWLGTRTHLPASLESWTGDGWKQQIETYFEAQVATFNTPNADKCGRLLKMFAGIDIAEAWVWPPYTFVKASERLDKVIELRGELAHTARRVIGGTPERHLVKRERLEKEIEFIRQLVSATEKALTRAEKRLLPSSGLK